ncbi:MAG: magnesium/cobalt transporter CorA [Candidatus Peribacteraceae bacterium]|jgi:magnesium transporter
MITLPTIPFFLKNPKKRGLPPGTLVHVGRKRTVQPRATVWHYSADAYEEKEIASAEELEALQKKKGVLWVNVDGIHDTKLVESIGQAMHFHPLLIEDIVSTAQRPKVEDFGEYFFVVTKMLQMDPATGSLDVEQISLVVMENAVLSFQEKPQDVFDDIRERVRQSKGPIRERGADYLAYRLLDAIVDGYYGILSQLGDRIEELEKELLEAPDTSTLTAIHHLQRELVFVRKAVWPLRDVLIHLRPEETSIIKAETQPYLRDVYDHAIQIIDAVETYRDMATNMLSNYLSIVSNRMNQVMKVLTIVATIFIPLTFVAGVYGMNFQHMPELQSPWGYPAVLIFMATIGIGMALFFRWKKWM